MCSCRPVRGISLAAAFSTDKVVGDAVQNRVAVVQATGNEGLDQCFCNLVLDRVLKVKGKLHTLDIAALRSESPPQKRSGMARVFKGFHSFTCTPTRSSAIGMSHTCLFLSSRSWYTHLPTPEGWKAE